MNKDQILDIFCDIYDFEDWYKEYKDTDNFEEYMWADEALNELEEELLDQRYLIREVEIEKDKLLRAKSREWFNHRIEEFYAEFSEIAKIIGDSIVLTRVITIKDIFSEFLENAKNSNYGKYNGIGVYWSWDGSKAQAHWGEERCL